MHAENAYYILLNNMQVWDEELAAAALSFSLQCTIHFRGATVSGFNTVGRNHYNDHPHLHAHTAFTKAVAWWFSRNELFDYDANRCEITNDQCNVYRQVWLSPM